MRMTTSARRASGRLEIRSPAWDALRWARIRAMVWGCSFWMNLESCWGLARSMLENPAEDSSALVKRSMILRAASGPTDLMSSFLAYSMPPWAM